MIGIVRSSDEDIRRKKMEFWSRTGAAVEYEQAIKSKNSINQIKNLVELEIVLKNVKGFILDAGTGTGRFAIPLACNPENVVVALDYSNEMLDLNRKLSAQQGINTIEYVQGDIEHLKYPADYFDAIVSITVVRHFPQWQNILKEYARVLKPRGKLVFEMCSGDHIVLANRISPRFGLRFKKDGFYNFEAEVPFDNLHTWLDSIGIDIEDRLTYDFLNNNCFLKIVTINDLGYKIVRKAIGLILRLSPLKRLMVWMELKVLRYFPPSFSYNYMVIGQKR